MTVVYPNFDNFPDVPVEPQAFFSNSSGQPIINQFDAPQVIAGNRARSSSTPIKHTRVSVNFDNHRPKRASVGDSPATDNYFGFPLPPAPSHLNTSHSFPAFNPNQNDNDPFLPPSQAATQDNDVNDLPPDTFSGDEASVQDAKADFSDLLDPIAKVQKKMKLRSLAVVVAAVALAVLGLMLIITGSATGILPLLAAIPLLYLGYNGYRVSENLARIIKNPDQIISADQVIQIDAQKIKQSLKEKTLYFDWAIDKGTDYLLNNANPTI